MILRLVLVLVVSFLVFVLFLLSSLQVVCGRGRSWLLQAADETHLYPLTSSPTPYKPGLHSTTLPNYSVMFGSTLSSLFRCFS